MKLQIRAGKGKERTVMGNKVREREKGRRGEESGGGMRQTRDSGLKTQYELGIA